MHSALNISMQQFKSKQEKKSFHLNIHPVLSLSLSPPRSSVELEQQSSVGRA